MLTQRILFAVLGLFLFTSVAGVEASHAKTKRYESKSFNVLYSPPHLERAKSLAWMIEGALEFYRNNLGLKPKLRVWVFDKKDWDTTLPEIPYGIPAALPIPDESYVLAMPATFDNVLVQYNLKIEKKLSETSRRRIDRAGLPFPEAARLQADLVALHELGHVLNAKSGIWIRAPWFEELMATYFGYSYMLAERPGWASLWEGYLEGYVEALPNPAHHTLEAFDEQYGKLPIENFVWFHGMFAKRVGELAPLHQPPSFIPAIAKLYENHEKPDLEGLDVFLPILEGIAPGFIDWARKLR